MPNLVNGPNAAVATLMYQVGVSVDMNYSPQSSGAYVISTQSPVTNCAEYALKTYFGYKNTLQGLERRNYSDLQWTNLLKAELDASRPIIYAGFGNGGGHCFIADGYNNNEYFHFNWGWGGYYDGYFEINALNPTGVGTGGGSGGYNSGQQAVIGIQPPPAQQTAGLSLYDFVTPSSNTINYGQAFSISTNVVNSGTSTFNGDYTAAIFDNAKNFVDTVQVLSGYSLQSGYHYINNLVFSTSGKFNLLPGVYYIGIFFREAGGNWIQVANSGGYANLIQVTVVNPNAISLYSAMVVSPDVKLTRGQPASVNLNIVNEGATAFTGQYNVSLYKVDGSFAQSIGTIEESSGLPSGYTYLPPYLTFSTPSVTVAPGTYLLAAQHNPANTGWQLTGSSYFQNPIKLTVVEASLQPDVYEPNDSGSQSYTLALSFNGDNATVRTQGANCHTVADNDYFRINLPEGYNYTLTPRLYDSYSNDDGGTYTLDALFSFSTDAVNWSESYDDVMPSSVVMSGGHPVYFHVAPYFAGETGTYLLEIKLTKTPYVFVWTGTINSDWSNAGNWSTGTVPTDNDDVTIPANTPYAPVIHNGTCRSITVSTGAQVSVAEGGQFNINKK